MAIDIRRQIYRPSSIKQGQRLLTTAMTERNPPYGAWAYLLLLLLAGVWGSSFILMKIGLFGWTSNGEAVMDGVQLGLLRICLAGTVMVPIALRHVRGLDRSTWTALAINGFIGSLTSPPPSCSHGRRCSFQAQWQACSTRSVHCGPWSSPSAFTAHRSEASRCAACCSDSEEPSG